MPPEIAALRGVEADTVTPRLVDVVRNHVLRYACPNQGAQEEIYIARATHLGDKAPTGP